MFLRSLKLIVKNFSKPFGEFHILRFIFLMLRYQNQREIYTRAFLISLDKTGTALLCFMTETRFA